VFNRHACNIKGSEGDRLDRLESMAVFVDIVATGSLAAAAEQRGLSPSMVGKHLRFLEEHFGAQLLQRTTRRQRLTESGELFLERCREILSQIEQAKEDAQAPSKSPSGLLRVSAPISFGVTQLSPALPEFLSNYENVRIDLTLTDAPIDPVSHNVDVAFRIGPLADSWLIARPLTPYWMVVCASPNYLAKHGTPALPQELKKHVCLGHTRWGLRHAWHFDGPEGLVDVPLDYRMRIDNGPALREAARSGAGIIMQPRMLVSEDIRSGKLKQLLTNYKVHPRPFYLVHARNRKLPAKVRSFVEFAMKRFCQKE
jgi:DNA-binding transcriptional LysR family regulator